ncbi:sn-glycerol-3-phosphate import ATP-binding protein UgpC [Methylopila jiangsuensis]|uniref:Sn-glycerol-3-phosphate import ATP-binding protein UgpC n=1 Tax=Methylopila jiangsuensis TaxID=586230 RepID=A0A9W6N3V0_9HYPH|nr:ATP-binding cassette domain-containing protein [Methylopila jiangsuensis]MDR6286972.1 ABC-type sugar transport system ATPase subunit [Methylopila jiangsuensis]GLK76678.1 sn-glycerol-3-phosphate import ATP-binding protein UgpC [Methylopila jiangsuensis]
MSGVVFDDVVAGAGRLNGLSFAAPAGTIVALVGGDRAARRLALDLLTGAARPASGEVRIGDFAARSFGSPLPHGVALSLDGADFAPRRNLYDAIASGLRQRGLSRAEAEARALHAADRYGLGGALATRARDASLPHLRRTALARAFAHRPPAIVADEPFADRALGEAAAELRALRDATGATLVVAVGDAGAAIALADAAVLLRDGRAEASGAPTALYERPPTVAASGFGPYGMNVLPVRANQTGLSLEDGTTLGGASVRTGATFALLGVRPEHLFPWEGDMPPEHGARLPVIVENVQSTGADLFATGRIGAFSVTARLPAGTSLTVGAPAQFGVKGEHLHMFDPRTGERLA